MITLTDLSLAYDDKQVLDHFSLTLPDQGIIGLLGPSGCGKSTLLHLMSGLLKPDSGSIAGYQPADCGILFQEDRLLPWLTVERNIAAVARSGITPAQALELACLPDSATLFPDELSGGMKRRAALARLFALDAAILLLDEPFNGIDQQTKQQLIQNLKRYCKNRLCLVVTHQQDDLTALCDTTIQLQGPPLRQTS